MDIDNDLKIRGINNSDKIGWDYLISEALASNLKRESVISALAVKAKSAGLAKDHRKLMSQNKMQSTMQAWVRDGDTQLAEEEIKSITGSTRTTLNKVVSDKYQDDGVTLRTVESELIRAMKSVTE